MDRRRRTWQRLLAALIGILSLTMLPPALLAWFDQDQHLGAFLQSFGLLFLTAALLWWPVRVAARHELRLRDGFLIVTAAWVVAAIGASLPFLLSPALDLKPMQALFESTSGLTTTGATVIVGLDDLPRSLLFFRSSLHFLGGMGIIVLAVAVLPLLKIGGSQLVSAETTGPMKDQKLTPRIRETARSLWLIYIGLNALCAMAYWMAGMSMFDAICHAFATVGTAGFSTHDSSMGFFNSALIEWIAIVFMIAGATSFALHFIAWRDATTRHYWGDEELRTFLGTLLLLALAGALTLTAIGTYSSFGESFRMMLFQTVSYATTTGFTSTGSIAGPHLYPLFIPVALMMAGIVGGCRASTTGGMKTIRWLLLSKLGLREVKRLIHPSGQFVIKVSGQIAPEPVIQSIYAFLTLYVLVLAALLVSFTACGIDPLTALAAAVTCLANIGPALGEVAANFASMDQLPLAISCLAMLLGRLDLFAVLVLLSPEFWRN